MRRHEILRIRKRTRRIAVILHGGGTSYRGVEPTANLLGEKYHVILVAYDGFNPSEPETEFVSPMDEAKRLGDYAAANYGGKIDILYGHATWKSWKNQGYYLIGRKTDRTLFEKTHAHLWYGIKGNVDKKLSSGLDGLRKKGYKFDVKIFPKPGHGGLTGEQPERFVDEVSAAHEKDIGK